MPTSPAHPRPHAAGPAEPARRWACARRLLVCWLLLTLPLQGLAGILDHLLGAAHVHRASSAPALLPVLLDVNGWRHSPGAAGRAVAADAAPHHHPATGRHAHAHGDPTVVAVEVPGEDAAAAARTKPASIDLGIPPPPGPTPPEAGLPARARSGPGPEGGEPGGGRLERPPRG